MKKIAIASLGCSKNLVDTEHMLGLLAAAGYQITEDESEADVLIVNTCSFINDAKQESIDTILDMARWKTEGKCKRLIVTGCLAQRYQDSIIEELPEVDAVLGVGAFDQIIEAVEGTDEAIQCQPPYHHLHGERITTTPHYTAFLKIADGCSNHCTYCVIPSIRGPFLSRPMEEIVQEAKTLAANGVKELIVIAQDTTNYGVDLYGERRLVQLLEQLCRIDGVEWIRLHYCYPERIDDALIDLIAREEKICKYIDIPIQHINDDILKKMARLGRREQIVALLSKLRQRVPGITIRTTLIAGFPTETEEQFNELAEFVQTAKFDRLGVFAYSQEEETVAGEMDGQIDDDVKAHRAELLMLVQSEVSREINQQKVGTSVKVLTEGYDNLIKQYYGRSEADSADIDGKVFFTSSRKVQEGEFVTVKVNDFMDYDLFGEMEEAE